MQRYEELSDGELCRILIDYNNGNTEEFMMLVELKLAIDGVKKESDPGERPEQIHPEIKINGWSWSEQKEFVFDSKDDAVAFAKMIIYRPRSEWRSQTHIEIASDLPLGQLIQVGLTTDEAYKHYKNVNEHQIKLSEIWSEQNEKYSYYLRKVDNAKTKIYDAMQNAYDATIRLKDQINYFFDHYVSLASGDFSIAAKFFIDAYSKEEYENLIVPEMVKRNIEPPVLPVENDD